MGMGLHTTMPGPPPGSRREGWAILDAPILAKPLVLLPVQKRKRPCANTRILGVTPCRCTGSYPQLPAALAHPCMRIALIEDHQMLRELIVPLLRDDLGYVLTGAVGSVTDGIAL